MTTTPTIDLTDDQLNALVAANAPRIAAILNAPELTQEQKYPALFASGAGRPYGVMITNGTSLGTRRYSTEADAHGAAINAGVGCFAVELVPISEPVGVSEMQAMMPRL